MKGYLPLNFWKEDTGDPMLSYFPTIQTHQDEKYLQMEVSRRKFIIYSVSLYLVKFCSLVIQSLHDSKIIFRQYGS